MLTNQNAKNVNDQRYATWGYPDRYQWEMCGAMAPWGVMGGDGGRHEPG